MLEMLCVVVWILLGLFIHGSYSAHDLVSRFSFAIFIELSIPAMYFHFVSL
jgi:hypothetical protein